ncbi:serine/threonine protein kinase [Candidatus Micrarchaeota archaeon]|nr:serine/threonine protein kinase [Candidatus Micrarchaeota archaeon]
MTQEFLNSRPGKFRKTSYALANGTVLKGKYAISSRIAWGGVGEIYCADSDKGKVVVKTPWKEKAADLLLHDIFDNERMVLEKARHPGVVNLIDSGKEENMPFLVLEYLGTHIMEYEFFNNIHSLLETMTKVCDCLSYIHSKNIVHCDLRPSNIMLLDSSPILIDFQYSMMPEAPDIRSRMPYGIGSPDFMSPEQTYQFSPIDHRADIYSLAISLYFMAGRIYSRFREGSNDFFPFIIKGATFQEYIECAREKHRHEDPIPLHIRLEQVPKQLSDVIQKALSKDPDKRQQSAEEFASDMLKVRDMLPPSNYFSM